MSPIEPTFLQQQTELHFPAVPHQRLAAPIPATGKEPNSEGRRSLGEREVEAEEGMTGVEGKDSCCRWGPNPSPVQLGVGGGWRDSAIALKLNL